MRILQQQQTKTTNKQTEKTNQICILMELRLVIPEINLVHLLGECKGQAKILTRSKKLINRSYQFYIMYTPL